MYATTPKKPTTSGTYQAISLTGSKPELSTFLDECQRVKKPRTRSARASA
jgi:hypothetical protein